MELKINIVEAAAEIAENQLKMQYANDFGMKWGDPTNGGKLYNMIYTEGEDDVIVFTEEAQDLFNAIYDEIFTKLMDCKVTPVPNLFNSKNIFSEDLVEELARQATNRDIKVVYEGCTEEFLTSRTWKLGELNSLVYTEEAQDIYDRYKLFYEQKLNDFEI